MKSLRTLGVVAALVAAVALLLLLTNASVTPEEDGALQRAVEDVEPYARSTELADAGGDASASERRAAEPEAASAPTDATAPTDAPDDPRWTLVLRTDDGGPLRGLEGTVQRQSTGGRPRVTYEPLAWDGELEPDGGARWPVELEGANYAQVELWAPGYRSHDYRGPAVAGSEREFLFMPGATVTGRVVDDAGEPVAGARVALHLREDGAPAKRLGGDRTDAEGRYRIGTVESGPCLVVATRREQGRGTAAVDLAPRAVLNPPAIVLQGDGELLGRVVFGSGAPAAELDLSVEALGERTSEGLREGQQRTDAEGRFHFRGLAAGEYQVSSELANFRTYRDFGEAGRVRTGPEAVELTLHAARVVLRGEDADGNPLDLQHIRALDPKPGGIEFEMSWAGAAPSHELLLPSGGPYELGSDLDAGVPLAATVELPVDVDRVEVTLRPIPGERLASVELQLTGPEGQRIEAYRLSLRGEDGQNAYLRAPQDLVEEAFTGLRPGSYAVSLKTVAWPPGEANWYPLEVPETAQLVAGRRTTLQARAGLGGRLEIDLSSSPPLIEHHTARLTVREPGRPIGDALRTGVFWKEGEFLSSSTAPPLGRASTTDTPLPPGTYLLRLEANDYEPWEATVEVRAGETTPVRPTLQRE